MDASVHLVEEVSEETQMSNAKLGMTALLKARRPETPNPD